MLWRSVAISLILVQVACQAGSDQSDSVIRTDSAGIQIALNEIAISSLPGRTVDSIPVLEITGDDGGDVVLFQVVDITPVGEDLIAVAANSSGQIHMFRRDGVLVRSIGGQGNGPGEFQVIGNVLPLGTDSLVVYDPSLRRLTVFAVDGSVGRTADVSGLLPVRVSSTLHPLPDGFALVGEAGIGSGSSSGIHRDSAPSYRLTLGGDSAATYGSFPGMEYSVGEGMRGMLPFGSTLFSGTRGDRLLVGFADSPELREYGPSGALMRLIRWPDRDREVTEQRVAEFIEHTLEPMPEAQRAPARAALSAMPHAASEPAYHDLVVSLDGMAWVGDYPGPEALLPQNPGPSREWKLIDSTGALTEVVTTPPGFRLMAVEEDRLWGLHIDDMGVETVWALSLE